MTTDILHVLILSRRYREHDSEDRSLRLHNQWITTLLEDTGRFLARVVEDPRGLGAEIIDKYDVLIVVFEGRDGFFEAVGCGPRRMPRSCTSCRRGRGRRVVPRVRRAGRPLGVPRVPRRARREDERI